MYGRLASISFAVAAFCSAGAFVVPAAAQTSTLDGVMAICTPVIEGQYQDEDARRGECVAAVGAYLDAIGAPSDAANDAIADLVVALAELYRNDDACSVQRTELPEAITLAAQASTDEEQEAQIIQISDTIADCTATETAAIGDDGPPAILGPTDSLSDPGSASTS